MASDVPLVCQACALPIEDDLGYVRTYEGPQHLQCHVALRCPACGGRRGARASC